MVTCSELFGTVFRPHTISPIDWSKYAPSSWVMCFLHQGKEKWLFHLALFISFINWMTKRKRYVVQLVKLCLCIARFQKDRERELTWMCWVAIESLKQPSGKLSLCIGLLRCSKRGCWTAPVENTSHQDDSLSSWGARRGLVNSPDGPVDLRPLFQPEV